MIALVLALAAAQMPPGPPPGSMVYWGETRLRSSLADGYDSGEWDAALRAQGMSAKGIEALHRGGRTPAIAAQERLRRGVDAIRDEAAVVAASESLDFNRLAAALKARDDHGADRAHAQTSRLIAALRRLGPADRAVLLKLVGTSSGTGLGLGRPPPPGGFDGAPLPPGGN